MTTVQADSMREFCQRNGGHTPSDNGRFCLTCHAPLLPDVDPGDALAETLPPHVPGSVAAETTVRGLMGLPSDDTARKAMPIFDGCLMYFPHALLAVAEVSKAGNDQHNPGEPLHWARGKSMDQYNTAIRHVMDHGLGNRFDYNEAGECTGRHLAKAAWRILAALQLDIEAEYASATQSTAKPENP